MTPDDSGWRPDPASRHELRYHDGSNWTQHVSDNGVQAEDPLPQPPLIKSKRGGLPGWAPWAIAGVVGLVLGAAAGGSSSETKTVTEASVTTETTTQAAETKTVTVKPKTKTVTTTKTVTKAAAAVQPTSSSGGKSFSGNGGKKLPPFTVDRGSTLRWTNDGDVFQVFSDDLAVSINSQAHSGSTYIPSGRYTLDINALGNWTIKITPA